MPKRQIAIMAAGLVVLLWAIVVTSIHLAGDKIGGGFKDRLNRRIMRKRSEDGKYGL